MCDDIIESTFASSTIDLSQLSSLREELHQVIEINHTNSSSNKKLLAIAESIDTIRFKLENDLEAQR